MSQTGKQNPLGVNVNSSTLRNIGFYINPVAAGYMGASRINSEYSFGSIVQNTCLRLLTWAIHDAYNRGVVDKTPAGTSVYDNLITIGQGVIEALGNSKPPTYIISDPSGRWTVYNGPATTGYGISSGNTDQGQSANWVPYLMTNPNHSVTQWGFVRCWALQAWNEFNWNGGTLGSASATTNVQYKEFTSSFLTAQGYIDYMNVAINSMQQGQTFLKGSYSNMNDLSSADITGVSLATVDFGQDCITAGKVIDLSKLFKFGLPSVLLQTIKKHNTLNQSLILALLAAGLTNEEIDTISNYNGTATKRQEQQIYGAFLIITGSDLEDILIPLNCKTQGLETLADLLNVKKLFPNSYKSLTVPIYNSNPGPTNSKTYYPIFEGNEVSARLNAPEIIEQVGTTIPPGEPVIIEEPVPPLTIEIPIQALVTDSPATTITPRVENTVAIENTVTNFINDRSGGIRRTQTTTAQN